MGLDAGPSVIERLRNQRDTNAANLARVSAVAGSMRASLTYIKKLLEKRNMSSYDIEELRREVDQTLARCDVSMREIERNKDEGPDDRLLASSAATSMDTENPH